MTDKHNKLEDYFYNKKDIRKYEMSKWNHYFEIYERHFSKFIGKSPKILDIGVHLGGSLEMWDYYFNGDCQIVGVDNNPSCADLCKEYDNIEILIGDQEDINFWKSVKDKVPYFDIVIDDGGHHMSQQITTFEEMYNHMSENGVYLVEDTHTSYWPNWGGCADRSKVTFIEFSKTFIDLINAQHWAGHPWAEKRLDEPPPPVENLQDLLSHEKLSFSNTVNSLHFYDSVFVMEKRQKTNLHTSSQQ